MKKIIVLSALFVSALTASAQTSFTLTEGEPALVYALPKTELCIEVQWEKTTQKPGQFYRYSERYLATNKVIVDEKTSYRLKNIVLSTRAIPDPARTYAFVPGKKAGGLKLTVDADGILCGVNVPSIAGATPARKTIAVESEIIAKPTLLPLGEEFMMASSDAKLAEGAAKQIYRIRESRVSLLTADVERLPADGASFASMLQGLNTLERELTELFIGKSTTETQTQCIYLSPAAATSKEVLFRFSSFKGLVAPDDLSGTPYYLNINPSTIASNAGGSEKEKSGLYYVLPASTQVSIGDGVNPSFVGQFDMPQFGKTIPVSNEVLQQPNVKVHIDHQTGRLLSVE